MYPRGKRVVDTEIVARRAANGDARAVEFDDGIAVSGSGFNNKTRHKTGTNDS